MVNDHLRRWILSSASQQDALTSTVRLGGSAGEDAGEGACRAREDLRCRLRRGASDVAASATVSAAGARPPRRLVCSQIHF